MMELKRMTLSLISVVKFSREVILLKWKTGSRVTELIPPNYVPVILRCWDMRLTGHCSADAFNCSLLSRFESLFFCLVLFVLFSRGQLVLKFLWLRVGVAIKAGKD